MRSIAVVLLLASCAPKAPLAAYTPSFSYTPTPGTGGAGISLALVNPDLSPALSQAVFTAVAKEGRVITDPREGLSPTYMQMLDAMSNGFLAYLTGQGMTVSGPFSSADDMTFPEKKQADLTLTVEVNLDIGAPTPELMVSQYLPTRAVASGPCFADGDVSFVLWEPLSAQRMLVKKVDVRRSEEDCSWNGREDGWTLFVGNANARLEEQAFAQVMGAFERYFTAEEVALVKRQAEELRAKKVY